jgi:hypothetical protein
MKLQKMARYLKDGSRQLKKMFYKFVSIITVGKLFICVFKFIWVSLTTFFKIGYMKKTMKILQLLILAIFVYSCGSGGLNQSKGELIGVKGKKYYPEKPYGMTLIPGGSYIMGKSDDDIASIEDAPTKTVTVRSFYMDETEIPTLSTDNLLIGPEILC